MLSCSSSYRTTTELQPPRQVGAADVSIHPVEVDTDAFKLTPRPLSATKPSLTKPDFMFWPLYETQWVATQALMHEGLSTCASTELPPERTRSLSQGARNALCDSRNWSKVPTISEAVRAALPSERPLLELLISNALSGELSVSSISTYLKTDSVANAHIADIVVAQLVIRDRIDEAIQIANEVDKTDVALQPSADTQRRKCSHNVRMRVLTSIKQHTEWQHTYQAIENTAGACQLKSMALCQLALINVGTMPSIYFDELLYNCRSAVMPLPGDRNQALAYAMAYYLWDRVQPTVTAWLSQFQLAMSAGTIAGAELLAYASLDNALRVSACNDSSLNRIKVAATQLLKNSGLGENEYQRLREWKLLDQVSCRRYLNQR